MKKPSQKYFNQLFLEVDCLSSSVFTLTLSQRTKKLKPIHQLQNSSRKTGIVIRMFNKYCILDRQNVFTATTTCELSHTTHVQLITGCSQEKVKAFGKKSWKVIKARKISNSFLLLFKLIHCGDKLRYAHGIDATK